MNKRQRKKMGKKRFMNNLKESLDEIMLMREGKLPKTTWKEFREKLKSNTK